MKTLFSPFTVILVVLILGITGCSSQPAQSPPTQTPAPEVTTESASETVQKMIERMNAGDVEGSLAYFADDAMAYIVGLPPTGMEAYNGKDQIRTLWQDSVANHFQWETEIISVEGNIVFVKAKTWHDFTRQLEVAPLEYIDVYDVQDGKITTYGTTITADALARFKPAFAEVVPPEDPIPSTEQPVSEMTVTIAGGTCTIDNPAPLQAGEITATLNIKDQNKVAYVLSLFYLDQDKDILDLMASTAGMPPSWADILLLEELEPGKNATYTFTAEKGPVYMVCWSKYPELPIGNAGPIEVIGGGTATTLDPASLAVSLDDLLGTWITFCPPAGEECTWEFREDGTYGGELVRIPGFVFSGKFTFENGLLTFETDSGLCSDSPQATYEVHVVKQTGVTEELQFKAVGKDLCKDRRLSFAKVRPYEQ